MVLKEFGTVDGGEFYCNIHDFKADNKLDWDTHIVGHYDEGYRPCGICGLQVEGKFDVLPDGTVNAVCEICGPERDIPVTGKRTGRRN